MTSPLAALFLTNQWRLVDQARFARLVRECGDRADCFLMVDDRTSITGAEAQSAGLAGTYFFNGDTLPASLGYTHLKKKGIMPGRMHFPVIEFAQRQQYEKYLLLENDLEFTGDWTDVANVCRTGDFDLLASHLYTHAEKPEWPMWKSLSDPQGTQPPPHQMRKAFLPCACYSRRALLYADAIHRRGWKGHFEVLLPTVLTMEGMVVSDLNQYRQFYIGTEQNPQPPLSLHTLSSLRWRPPVTIEEFEARFQPGVFFHPVKDDWMWVDGRVRRFRQDVDPPPDSLGA